MPCQPITNHAMYDFLDSCDKSQTSLNDVAISGWLIMQKIFTFTVHAN